jgi:hypothetical protein
MERSPLFSIHPPQQNPTYLLVLKNERKDTSSVAKPLLAC